MCLSLETQRILEHTLNVPPDTDRSVDEVLNVLQEYIKNLRNKALRRRDLLSCKQREGESFNDFYVRLKHVAEEIDVCPGHSAACEETQLDDHHHGSQGRGAHPETHCPGCRSSTGHHGQRMSLL